MSNVEIGSIGYQISLRFTATSNGRIRPRFPARLTSFTHLHSFPLLKLATPIKDGHGNCLHFAFPTLVKTTKVCALH